MRNAVVSSSSVLWNRGLIPGMVYWRRDTIICKIILLSCYWDIDWRFWRILSRSPQWWSSTLIIRLAISSYLWHVLWCSHVPLREFIYRIKCVMVVICVLIMLNTPSWICCCSVPPDWFSPTLTTFPSSRFRLFTIFLLLFLRFHRPMWAIFPESCNELPTACYLKDLLLTELIYFSWAFSWSEISLAKFSIFIASPGVN